MILPTTSEEAIVAVHDILDDKCFGDAGNSLVIEDYLEGEEVSVLAFTDGTSIHCMPIAQVSLLLVIHRVFNN